MVLEVPDASLKEYLDELKARYGVEFGEKRLGQILKALDISRKIVVPSSFTTDLKMQEEARERDPILRAAWFRKLASYDAKQLVFLDESGFNSKLGRRFRGFAPKGQAVRMKVKLCKAEHLSMLPAFTVDGYIACNVYRGAVSKEDYIAFLDEDLLPLCGPYPAPRSIIVMDNCSIHHGPVSPRS
jgi:hypothetical protein